MKVQRKKMTLALGTLFAGVSGMGFFGISYAQQAEPSKDQPQKIEKIQVTGSNIKRVDTETPAPIQVISREEIERSGKSTVAELLRSIPSNTGNSYGETFTNSFSPGASGISLRGLGQKSTLVLVNGRRVANYGFAQNLQDTYVDLNSLPSSAIERIEILKDGASAIYGSDAIAGVVNIVMRTDYTGAEATVGLGTSTHRDLSERKVSLAGGIGQPGTDRFNVMGVFDYFHRDLLTYDQRDFTKDSDFRGHPGGLFAWGSGAGTYINPNGANTRATFANCEGFRQPVPAAQFGNSRLSGSSCAFNPAPFYTLFPETERMSFVGRGTFDISPNLSAFGEVWVSHNETDQKFSPSFISSSAVVYDPRTGGIRTIIARLPVGNPSNPYRTPVSFSHTFFDVGGRDAHVESDFNRALVGLRGTVQNWDWEVAGGASKSKTTQNNYNAIDAVVLERVMADGSYNFVNPSLTPEVTNQLRVNPVRKSDSKLSFFDAKVSSELMQLPAGPLGFAAGFEYRKEEIQDIPDALYGAGRVLASGSSATDGSRDSKAGYFEFNIPALKSLEFQLAGRQDKYSDFGSAFSPKASAKWTPIKELLLRASFAKGFRAPTLPENSQSAALSFSQITDPKQNLTYTVSSLSLGNPDLKAEHSKSYTLGFVIEPSREFNFGLDYYNIRQDDLVKRETAQFVIDNESNPAFAGRVVRDPVTGNIIYVTRPYQNVEYVQTSGLDFDYKVGLPKMVWGKLTLSGQASYLLEYKQPVARGEEATDGAGNNNFDAFPRFRAVNRLSWEHGDWVSQVSWNYMHGYSQVSTNAPPADSRVKPYSTADLFLSYKGIKNLTISGSVRNILNRDPPFDLAFGSPYYAFSQYDLRGRYFDLVVNYKFK